MIQVFLCEAIYELGNSKSFEVSGTTYDNFVVESSDPENPVVFDRDAVITKARELEAEYNSKDYQRKRQPEYPDMADLADALYWSSKGDNTKLDAYYAACEAVKTKYPKP
jgi:hypothetical protein